MRGRRSLFGFIAALVAAGTAAAVVGSVQGQASNASAATRAWATRDLTGNVRLAGQVPLAVAKIPGAAASQRAGYVRHHSPTADLGLNFAFPLRDKAGLDRLIAQEAKTHQYLTRAQIYARFAPPAAQVNALAQLARRARLPRHPHRRRPDGVTAYAPTAVVEKTLHVKINDYLKPAFTFRGLKVRPYQYYANTTAPDGACAPRRADISGLSDVDRFFTSAQLSSGSMTERAATAVTRTTRSSARCASTSAAAATSRPTCAGSTTSRATVSTAPARRSASRCGPPPSASRR